MPHPKKIETVHVEKLDQELCIYDWQRMEVHNLNPTAAKVWELCDGQTSPAQMAEKLQAELDMPHTEELVWLTLARLEKANLLQGEMVKPTGHKVITRRELLVGLGVAAALLPVISSIVAPGPVEAQSPQPPRVTRTPTPTPIAGCSAPLGQLQTFTFTGAEQQFIVPAGVTCLTIQAFGAQGSDVAAGGGEGGSIQATISVTPGETLFVYVGGQGQDGQNDTGGAGGFNGGGRGGDGTLEGNGGGGASDVRQGGNGLNNRVVVAGGGGSLGGSFGVGGHGGYPNGLDGINPFLSSMDGSGGTQTNGGAGGVGNGGGNNGTAGSFGSGGAGGGANIFAGGGGGGGYFGGGGGGGNDDINNPAAGAGGGGSSFVIPTATNVSSTIGGRTGNGQVVISF
jgi:hypothetical protein